MLVVPQGGLTALLTPERGGKRMESIPLPDFRQQLPGLSRDERNLILDQARIVLGQNYVHLTDKRRLTLVDPVAACELLRAKVATWGSSAKAELMFHEELLGVFHGIRDRHTRYLLPAPLADATAFLPFTVDIANDQGAEVAIVTELLPELDGRRNFLPGIRVTHWNGVSIDRLLGLGVDATGVVPGDTIQRAVNLTSSPL
jgi:hypothetical protein